MVLRAESQQRQGDAQIQPALGGVGHPWSTKDNGLHICVVCHHFSRKKKIRKGQFTPLTTTYQRKTDRRLFTEKKAKALAEDEDSVFASAWPNGLKKIFIGIIQFLREFIVISQSFWSWHYPWNIHLCLRVQSSNGLWAG